MNTLTGNLGPQGNGSSSYKKTEIQIGFVKSGKRTHTLETATHFSKIVCMTMFLVFCSVFTKNSFAIDTDKIAQAIWLAEGGTKAKKPFGVLSVPCNGYSDCRKICVNTINNNYKRWQGSDKSTTFLEFLAKRYAPVNAENDPKGYNKNWLKNVSYFLGVL